MNTPLRHSGMARYSKPVCCFFVQVLRLLRGSSVRGPVYRAVVAVAEGMHVRRSDLTSELVTKPLLETLLKCLDFTGLVEIFYFIRRIDVLDYCMCRKRIVITLFSITC